MSLFSSMQGDIWSLGGINFASPLNDILDKEEFTLEELLAEDDLLQEVKAKNDRLLEYLQTEEVVEKLVDYVVTAADEDADLVRKYKYPYMSCELFCCEVEKVLDILVESQNGKFLNKLFSLLDNDSPLDHYLAGYFEKILEMLFRRMTLPVMAYLNEGGIPLLKKFLKHIDNYSIMQIVQRVMLPHIPFSMEDIENLPQEEKVLYQCNWSFQQETCYLLCSTMLSGDSRDIPSHISDLLITVLQLSPHESLFLTHLCEPQCLDELLKHSFREYAERTSVIDIPSLESSLSLASLAVLDSLISRLCESMNPYEEDEGGENAVMEARKTIVIIGECVNKVSTALIEYVPILASQLSGYCESDVCGTFKSQSQHTFRRLGQRGLQLVKFVEAIVRLANDDIDNALCTSGALKFCVELMFQFELNSLLHLSVQRIILILIEGGAMESTIQHLLIDCGVLRRIIDLIGNDTNVESSNSDSPEKGAGSSLANCRKPVAGHVISIAQSIAGAMQPGVSMDISQDTSGEGDMYEGLEHNDKEQQHSIPLVKNVLSYAELLDEWENTVSPYLDKSLDRQKSFGNVESIHEASTDSSKISQMEAALEALSLNANDIDDLQNNVFDDDSDDDDDDNSDDEDDYNSYGFSSKIKVTAVVKDGGGVNDKGNVDFEDDEFEIGDQFANFDQPKDSFFEANFDVPQADFGADFESPQFESSEPLFEANFDNAQNAVGGTDLFADFASNSAEFDDFGVEKGNENSLKDKAEGEPKEDNESEGSTEYKPESSGEKETADQQED